jgi:NAD(P)-dependent dehydrogenase (short-subunit alcohol dehydrogenase family)
MDYRGRVAVVTGAASGIGRGFAAEAGSRGMRVALADVDGARLDATVRGLRGAGVEVTAHLADVADAASVEALADEVYSAHGEVHLLFNNAGVHLSGTSWRYSEKQWAWLMGINVMGVVNGVNAFLPRMISGGQEGIIANTASIAGLMSFPYSGCYCASKHAIVGFTESVQQDLVASGARIRMALVCPGAVATDIANASGANLEVADDPGRRDLGELAFRESFSAIINTGMPADAHAKLVFDELANGQFWVISDESYIPLIEERLRKLLSNHLP